MSDNYLKLIPEDPHYVASATALAGVKFLLEHYCPKAQLITIELRKRVVFFDAGGNLEAVYCPFCGSVQTDWFFRTTSELDKRNNLEDMAIAMPCCSRATTLNDLRFVFPAGFARCAVEVLNPDREWLTEEELGPVAKAMGCNVRQIFAHY
jgi:hypothetical protein